MSDIVERLRKDAQDDPDWTSGSKLLNEAADEITRLRAVVKADEERLRDAGERVDIFSECDTAEMMADEIRRLRAALAEATAVHRWNVDQDGTGSLMVCRHHHDKDEPCEWDRFVPAAAIADARNDALESAAALCNQREEKIRADELDRALWNGPDPRQQVSAKSSALAKADELYRTAAAIRSLKEGKT